MRLAVGVVIADYLIIGNLLSSRIWPGRAERPVPGFSFGMPGLATFYFISLTTYSLLFDNYRRNASRIMIYGD